MTTFTTIGQHLESTCKSYARIQSIKAEALAAKILASGVAMKDHPEFGEFVAIHNYLESVGR